MADSSDIDLNRIAIAEAIGTGVLILGGPGSAILAGPEVIGIWGIALAFGLSLAAMAYVIGPISGCHINPAVTLGMLLTRKVGMQQAIYSWVGQIVGGIAGAAVIYIIANSRDGWERGPFAANGWNRDGLSGLDATIIVEVVFTALLVFVVLATTSRRFAPGFGGLMAGLTLTLIHLVTIPVDNTSVNPARSIATAIFADADPNALGQLWAFIIFPMVGSAVGVLAWVAIDDETPLGSTMFGGGGSGARTQPLPPPH